MSARKDKPLRGHDLMPASDLLTTRDAARLLGISQRRLQALCLEGRLGRRAGPRAWVFTRQELERFRRIPRTPGRPVGRP